MSTNTAQLLAEIPLFSTMDDEERRQLCALMRERSFQPGQVVMAASDAEASFHIIEQGEAASLLSQPLLISSNRSWFRVPREDRFAWLLRPSPFDEVLGCLPEKVLKVLL